MTAQTNQDGQQFKRVFQNRSITIIAFSLLVLIASVIIVNLICESHTVWKTICEVMIGLASSAIAGAIVALLIDVPSRIDNFKKILLKSLTSREYISSLTYKEKEEMKYQITELLNSDNNKLPKSFLHLEEELGNFIKKPFYSYYTESVICQKPKHFNDAKMAINAGPRANNDETATTDELYIVKDVEIEYQLFNPSSNSSAIADIGMRKSLNLPDKIDIKDMFVIEDFMVKIDEMPVYNIKVDVNTYRKSNGPRKNTEAMTYNSTLSLSLKNNTDKLTDSNIASYPTDDATYNNLQSDNPTTILVEFKNRLIVKQKFKILVPQSDNHYTRRMRYSAQQSLFQYSCDDSVYIHGQVLGTLIGQDKITILQSDEKHITIQCRDWLLPGNGVFIVYDDKVPDSN